MNLQPSDDQAMLRESVVRFARAQAGAQVDAISGGLAELGLLALAVPADAGGMGGAADDLMVMMEAIGHELLGSSAIGLVAAVDVLGRHGTPSQRDRWVEPAMAGQVKVAFARMEDGGAQDGRLSGEVSFAAEAEGADAFVIAAPAGAFLVEAGAEGLEMAPFHLVDGTPGARLRLDRVAADQIQASAEQVEDCTARATVATCAIALGVMERLLADTVGYVKTRKQFGVAIGSFQVIQHRMARLYVAVGQCRSLVLAAALGESADRRAWRRSVAAARAFISEQGMHLAEECVQFHGGMGITQELEISRGHKQMMVLSRLFGSAEDARRAVDRLAGD